MVAALGCANTLYSACDIEEAISRLTLAPNLEDLGSLARFVSFAPAWTWLMPLADDEDSHHVVDGERDPEMLTYA